jgi:hypothetical protein
MLAVLRQVFDDHPQGIDIDAELSGLLAAGLRDMHRAALVLEQAEIERRELAFSDEELAPRRESERPAATVIAFPVIPRLRPLPAGGQNEGGRA